MKSTMLTVIPLLLRANLGYGFRHVVVAELSQSSFESIGHFECLYYGYRLCQVWPCSDSHSGLYAVYQGGSSSSLFLFHPGDESITQLTNQIRLARGRGCERRIHTPTRSADICLTMRTTRNQLGSVDMPTRVASWGRCTSERHRSAWPHPNRDLFAPMG
jgi:hypothetical protein